MIWSISLAAPPRMSRQPEKGALDQRVLGRMRTEQLLRDGPGSSRLAGLRGALVTYLLSHVRGPSGGITRWSGGYAGARPAGRLRHPEGCGGPGVLFAGATRRG